MLRNVSIMLKTHELLILHPPGRNGRKRLSGYLSPKAISILRAAIYWMSIYISQAQLGALHLLMI